MSDHPIVLPPLNIFDKLGESVGGLVGGLTAAPLARDGYTILKALDAQFVRQYLFKLEEAKAILKAYLEQVERFSRRLEKADATTQAVLGQDAFLAKKTVIQDTLTRLNAHEQATIKRLHHGG